METPDWLSKAFCKDRHIDLWYPPLEAENSEKYYSVAREFCKRCPVWRDCLDVGITETWGMWGGLTPLERTVLRDKNPRPIAMKHHGSWVRYRQGCRCYSCVEAEGASHEDLNINVVPKMNDSLGDLDLLKFLLLDP